MKQHDELLSRAALWPEHQDLETLTPGTLVKLAQRHGIDFATALLYDRLTKSPVHGPVTQRIERARSPVRIDAERGVIGIVPGAFYVESPHTGADGRDLLPEAQRRGWRCELIRTRSFGTLAESAAVLRRWLDDHRHDRIVLVSLSKGGAEVKWLLRDCDATESFQSVITWVNISGILNGTPLMRWLFERPWRLLLIRIWFWFRNHSAAALSDLAHGAGTPLDFEFHLPEHMQAVHVIGFPLSTALSSKLARRGFRRLASYGPNDGGGIVLAEACRWPGTVYPIWQADHYLRTADRTPASIVAQVLDWIVTEQREPSTTEAIGNEP